MKKVTSIVSSFLVSVLFVQTSLAGMWTPVGYSTMSYNAVIKAVNEFANSKHHDSITPMLTIESITKKDVWLYSVTFKNVNTGEVTTEEFLLREEPCGHSACSLEALLISGHQPAVPAN